LKAIPEKTGMAFLFSDFHASFYHFAIIIFHAGADSYDEYLKLMCHCGDKWIG